LSLSGFSGNCEIGTWPLGLRKWPAELRLKILSDIGVDDSPRVLTAPRGDPKLYHEALNEFYSMIPFTFTGFNGNFRHKVPAAVKSKIHDVVIWYVIFQTHSRCHIILILIFKLNPPDQGLT
jgi:hypothetical protein